MDMETVGSANRLMSQHSLFGHRTVFLMVKYIALIPMAHTQLQVVKTCAV